VPEATGEAVSGQMEDARTRDDTEHREFVNA
jgi:hypothetical protein